MTENLSLVRFDDWLADRASATTAPRTVPITAER